MKKTLAILLALALMLCVTACQKAPDPDELTVFAAASLTESLTAVGEKYMAKNKNVKINFTFDSSGKLLTQITEGAPCDLFLSAAPKQMNELEAAGLVLEGTRLDLLENKVVLVVADDENRSIEGFFELAEKLQRGEILLAVGNEDVPVGQYTEKIFNYLGIDQDAVSKNLTFGSNVKEVTAAVSEGAADCGIVYASDAFSAELCVVDEANEEMCGQVIYPAAVVNTSEKTEEAKAFLAYLQTEAAAAEFEKVFFTPLTK